MGSSWLEIYSWQVIVQSGSLALLRERFNPDKLDDGTWIRDYKWWQVVTYREDENEQHHSTEVIQYRWISWAVI